MLITICIFQGDFEQEGYNKLCNNPVCYAPCNDVKYGADVTYLPYYTPDIFDASKIDADK